MPFFLLFSPLIILAIPPLAALAQEQGMVPMDYLVEFFEQEGASFQVLLSQLWQTAQNIPIAEWFSFFWEFFIR